MRKLAEGSQTATEEIVKIVQGIQNGAQEAVNQMAKAKIVVEAQQVAVANTNASFKHISEIVQNMAERMLEIKASSEQIDQHVKSIFRDN